MLDLVAKLFGISADAPHLEEALTHPSFANEQGLDKHNQRLEFLGDAVLELCVSELLFERFPEADEGVLTRIRAQLVNTDSLAGWAREQEIAEALRLGRGAEGSNLRSSDNVLADFVEALIAVAYLDGGLEVARRACARIVESQLASLSPTQATLDPKTELQQKVQALGAPAPTYHVVDSGGPPHDRWFRVQVRIGAGWGATGRGRSKRLAERDAAERTLLLSDWEQRVVAGGEPEVAPSVLPEPLGAGSSGSP